MELLPGFLVWPKIAVTVVPLPSISMQVLRLQPYALSGTVAPACGTGSVSQVAAASAAAAPAVVIFLCLISHPSLLLARPRLVSRPDRRAETPSRGRPARFSDHARSAAWKGDCRRVEGGLPPRGGAP